MAIKEAVGMWIQSPRSFWTGEIIVLGISFSVAFKALSLVPVVAGGVQAERRSQGALGYFHVT